MSPAIFQPVGRKNGSGGPDGDSDPKNGGSKAGDEQNLK